jgi:hypothetical protein
MPKARRGNRASFKHTLNQGRVPNRQKVYCPKQLVARSHSKGTNTGWGFWPRSKRRTSVNTSKNLSKRGQKKLFAESMLLVRSFPSTGSKRSRTEAVVLILKARERQGFSITFQSADAGDSGTVRALARHLRLEELRGLKNSSAEYHLGIWR